MSHPSSLDLEAFACGEEVNAVASHLDGCDACRAFVESLRGLPAPAMKPAAKRRSPWNLGAIALPLAAAAVLLLLLRSPKKEGETIPTIAQPASTEEPATSFKGMRQVAVIRERDGEQKRFTGKVPVREGDRLRIEVAIDREQAILAAVVSDDGSTLELMPAAVRAPGTHYSEKSARVSGPPMGGKIVVGGTMQDAESVIRIEWEPSR
jgi:hypothetical protein